MLCHNDTAAFKVLFIVSLFYAWNITTVEINSGVHLRYLKVKSAKCLCLLPMVLVLAKLLNFEYLYSFGFGLKNLVLFTSLVYTVSLRQRHLASSVAG